jgi:hypothetical protein
MNVTGRPDRPPLTPREGWLSDGRQPPLLKRRKELTREQAIKLWRQKRQAGCLVCEAHWTPPPKVVKRHRPGIRRQHGCDWYLVVLLNLFCLISTAKVLAFNATA